MKIAEGFGKPQKRIVKTLVFASLFVLAAGALTAAYFMKIHSPQKDDAVKIIVIGKTNEDISFWLSLRNGVDAAGQEFKVTCEYRSPDIESDITTQINLVYQAIEERPDAIILAACDYEKLTAAARDVKKSGIPLIMIDSNVNGGGEQIEACFVATDNVAAGVKAGAALEALLPEGKKVAVISPLIGTNSCRDRDIGVRQGLDPKREVLATADSVGSEEVAFRITEKYLADPDIGGIICLNEYAAEGAARAFIAAGISDGVVLVGFDSSPDLNIYLEEGFLDATVIQRPFNMGYLAVVQALSVIEGKEIEPFYDTGSILVTKDTMYLEENEKLLFPFT